MKQDTREEQGNARHTPGRDAGDDPAGPGDLGDANRSPIHTIGAGGATALFVLFAVVVCGGLYWLVERHERAETEKSLLTAADRAARSMSAFRSFYSEEIVSRLAGSDVLVTHDYKNRKGAVPLPATLSIEFGRFLHETGSDTSLRLISDLPFPARAGRTLDAFQKEAIAHLKKDAREPFWRYENIGGLQYLRYAQGVTMGTSCVACHNAHPESPARNWKVGDLRGIQEVVLPVAGGGPAMGWTSATFRDIVVFVVAAFLTALLAIVWLVRRNRLAFANLETLAALERRRAGETRESKEQVEEALAQLRAVLDNVAEAIITIDEAGTIETANPATEKVFGYERQALIGRNVRTLMTEADARHHDGYIRRYCETGEARIIGIGREVVGRHRSGRGIPVELSISEVRLEDRRLFTGILRDVTSRKNAEKALALSQEHAQKLSLVAARTDNAIVITNAAGKIEWLNEAFTRMSGFSLEEAANRTPGELLQRDDVDGEAVSRIREALRAGRGFHEELLNYDKSGNGYWVEIDAQPILDPMGQVQQFIAIERNVTDRRRREREMEEARERAEEASQAKSRFLAMMSHEVRTPLNGVIGALGLLRDTDLNGEQRRYAETGRTAADSLLTIINDILDYSKMEAGKLDLETAAFDVRELVQSVAEMLSARCAEREIDFVCDVAADVPLSVEGDPTRTRQVLINLAGNAVKFTEKGEIRVTTEVSSSDAESVDLKFSVKDTGVGISPEDQVQLFEEFWTAEAIDAGKSVGTGLGLAISKHLVTMMGGEMGVKSAVGVGSNFWFKIPFSRVGDSPRAGATGQKTPGAVGELHLAGRILLVEDNPANQMISRVMLEKLGLKVDAAGNGIEAVEAMRTRPYDLVLMDIAMPEMGGIEATHRIRELETGDVRTPIIALTAHAMRGDREKFLSAGLDDYLVKPVSRSGLAACLSRWLSTVAPAQEEATRHAPAESSVLDQAMLDRLAEDVGPEILPDLVETFLSEMTSRVDLIEAAADAKDLPALAAQAHPLKSSAANFGAAALSRLAADIEAAARAGAGDAALAAARQTRTTAQAARELLNEAVRAGF